MEPNLPIESLLGALCEVVHTYAVPGERRAILVRRGLIDELWVTLPARCMRPAIQVLIEEFGIRHLSTITASDLRAVGEGAAVEVIYHFWMGRGLSLRCELPYEAPRPEEPQGERPCLASVCDLIPGAEFYEREAAEMLGIAFQPQVDGQPDPGPMFLPDDWEGGAPLRHDFVPGGDG
jgi:NADH:ubiquinone oxidoreductase subunit C